MEGVHPWSKNGAEGEEVEGKTLYLFPLCSPLTPPLVPPTREIITKTISVQPGLYPVRKSVCLFTDTEIWGQIRARNEKTDLSRVIFVSVCTLGQYFWKNVSEKQLISRFVFTLGPAWAAISRVEISFSSIIFVREILSPYFDKYQVDRR